MTENDQCDFRMDVGAKRWDHRLLFDGKPVKSRHLKSSAGEWK